MKESAPLSSRRRNLSREGLVAAIVLCVLLGIYSAGLSYAAIFIGFVSDSCGSCNNVELQSAIDLGMIGPPVVGIIAIILAIVRGARRTALAWVFPLAGGIVASVVWFIALNIGYASAGLNFWVPN